VYSTRQQLCFKHKLCRVLAVTELGFKHHLISLEAVFIMLILYSPTPASQHRQVAVNDAQMCIVENKHAQ
jgi:hypothetical protein